MNDTNDRVTHSKTYNSAQKQGYPYAPKKPKFSNRTEHTMQSQIPSSSHQNPRDQTATKLPNSNHETPQIKLKFIELNGISKP